MIPLTFDNQLIMHKTASKIFRHGLFAMIFYSIKNFFDSFTSETTIQYMINEFTKNLATKSHPAFKLGPLPQSVNSAPAANMALSLRQIKSSALIFSVMK